MDKTPAQKMRIRPNSRIAVVNDQSGVFGLVEAEGAVLVEDAGDADVVLLFVTAQSEVLAWLDQLGESLRPAAAFWIVYPKGSRAAGRDISRDTIWPEAEARGMRPVGMVSIDDTWSGFRLRPAG